MYVCKYNVYIYVYTIMYIYVYMYMCIFFVIKACEPKHRHAKYNLYSSFLKRASPNIPLDERGIFTHFRPPAKLLHSPGESTLISGEITPGKQDIRRNYPVSIELKSHVSFHLFQCWTT